MTTNNFNALLRHAALPAWLAKELDTEVQHGLANDHRLLLAAAVEGLLLGVVPGLHRLTVLDPLTTARLLAKSALIGKRLWKPAEKDVLLGKIEAEADLLNLLEYWVRARAAYRRRETREALDKLKYADGRPANLADLRAAQRTPDEQAQEEQRQAYEHDYAAAQ